MRKKPETKTDEELFDQLKRLGSEVGKVAQELIDRGYEVQYRGAVTSIIFSADKHIVL